METILVAVWLVVAAVLLGPPLLGVHRSTWPLKSDRFPGADGDGDDGTAPRRPLTPVGQCRACGEDGQAGFTYCRACLTPLLGVHRSTWPLKSDRFPGADRDGDAGTAPPRAPTPVGQCRACGEDGQAGFTYCRGCLTPLPQPEEGPDADGRDGHPAD